jgi:predicted DNA-binding antitoxin AbrB/MazE fold protein
MNNVITVTFDGQVLKPEIPLFLSQNKKYKIAIIPDEETPENQQNAWDILEDMAGTYEGPQDWSSEHNHYLYGTEKEDLAHE